MDVSASSLNRGTDDPPIRVGGSGPNIKIKQMLIIASNKSKIKSSHLHKNSLIGLPAA